MTREELNKRLAELSEERAKMMARLNGIEGAVMENKYWLERLEKQEAEPSDD